VAFRAIVRLVEDTGCLEQRHRTLGVADDLQMTKCVVDEAKGRRLRLFSRSTKSSSKVGPRAPLRSEFWLSETGMPWLAVRVWSAVLRYSALRRRPLAPVPDLTP
jgi:hypothetical protein